MWQGIFLYPMGGLSSSIKSNADNKFFISLAITSCQKVVPKKLIQIQGLSHRLWQSNSMFLSALLISGLQLFDDLIPTPKSIPCPVPEYRFISNLIHNHVFRHFDWVGPIKGSYGYPSGRVIHPLNLQFTVFGEQSCHRLPFKGDSPFNRETVINNTIEHVVGFTLFINY
jgi:hypothetical protein